MHINAKPRDLSLLYVFGLIFLRYVTRPIKIREIADKFISMIIHDRHQKHQYAAFHWRYDLKDWGAHREENLMEKILAIRKNPVLLVNYVKNLLQKRNITRLAIFGPPRKDHLSIFLILLKKIDPI